MLSSLLGLAIAASGALLALEVAWTWLFPAKHYLVVPWKNWRDGLSTVDWSNLVVQLVAGGAVVIGLLFILFASAARGKDIKMHEPAADVSVTTSPRSLARVVGQKVRAQDGVTGASVTASAKRVHVRADSRMHTEGELRPKLLAVAQSAVDSLPLPTKPRVSVVVSSTKDRS
jgi:hypothetical protein